MADLLKAHDPDTLRALFLASHYRRPIDYGPTRLDELKRGLQTFHNGFERFERLTGVRFDRLSAAVVRGEFDPAISALLKEVAGHRERLLAAMDDDFNTWERLGELFEVGPTPLNSASNGLDAGEHALWGSRSTAGGWSSSRS